MENSEPDPSRKGFSTPEPIYLGHEQLQPPTSSEIHPWQAHEAEGDIRLLAIIRDRDNLAEEVVSLGGTTKAPEAIVQNYLDACKEALNYKARKQAEKTSKEPPSNG